MAKIDLLINKDGRKNAIERFRAQNIILPTFNQQINPDLVPEKIKAELAGIGLWDLHPRNLFRITWKNQPKAHGGNYGKANYIEIPKSITGVDARILVLVGKWFPTGAHKVGAAYGCLVPRLVTGQFDPTYQKAVWPSTGNYCRGGAYDSALMACQSIAILPEGMSKERFEWLNKIASQVIATPGTESNVKEIFDKCWELRASGEPLVIFNQFEEFGNYLWHYNVTGHAMLDVLEAELGVNGNFAGVCLTTGSAGTIATGDLLKQKYPTSKVIASEALQCPTLLNNGFGAHRIEGIGDKHVPWIHNVKNTDLVAAIDDNSVVRISRLFNEPEGQKYLAKKGVSAEDIANLNLFGFSGIANMLTAIKFAKYYDLTDNDVVLSVLTDSMELYGTRIEEYREEFGEFTAYDAAEAYAGDLMSESTDHLQELTYQDRKRIHNLKYYTWVEQQGRTYQEIMDQWYDADYWTGFQSQITEMDELIDEFNHEVGLIQNYL
ncbi:MAG: pyridoxal-5-phosphate-dependent protein subunit beta [Chloroflexi bacterium HGW-Chloroflexi-10]|nr:MAG: pyridoxal-5-phosphate-dependent protein subunit beta [Chloroflexi bacterium HGW-Chloroflexi-10]